MKAPLFSGVKNRDLRATIFELFGDLPRGHRYVLERISGTPHASADAAACVLGLDLWRGPLARYRDHLIATGERPHLWTFAFGQSSSWETSRWSRLPLSARLVRSRAGYLDCTMCTRPTAWSLTMAPKTFRDGLNQLLKTGLSAKRADATYEFDALASPEELLVDLALVQILAHWFARLSDRERILADPHPSGFEVHGYDGCCTLCRSRWGLRERDPQWVPPFHPGCRCFAQPRFV